METVLVVGGSGMLGHDLIETLTNAGYEVCHPTSDELDITDPMSIAKLASGAFGNPNWVINCAAYTAVDKAETEVGPATELNTLAPGYLANACQALRARLIHISTDFVFDGTSNVPYDEDAPTNPLGVYGRSKRDGEDAVLRTDPNAVVVRTSWLFGAQGRNFPLTILNAYASGKTLRVVNDQIGCPTYTCHLAETLVEMINTKPPGGIYHATGGESMTWHAFATRTLRAHGKIVDIEGIPTSDYPTPAKRPAYSVLSNEKIQRIGVTPMPSIESALIDFCQRITR